MKFRNDVVKITNLLAEDLGIMVDIYTMAMVIENYCIKNGVNAMENDYTIEGGVLFINKEPIERVMPLPQKVEYGEAADYKEGCILAMQELC